MGVFFPTFDLGLKFYHLAAFNHLAAKWLKPDWTLMGKSCVRLKMNIKMLSPVGLHETKSKIWSHVSARTFGSQWNNVFTENHCFFLVFFFWFLFVARQQKQKWSSQNYIFLRFCFVVSMYNWKLQSVTERSKISAAPFFLHLVSSEQNSYSSAALKKTNKQTIAFQKKRKEM